MEKHKNNLLRFQSATTPILTYFGKIEQRKKWEHSGRIARSNILVTVIGGSAVFKLDGESYPVSAGDVFIILNDEYYEVTTPDFCEYYFAHFSVTIQKCTYAKDEFNSYINSPFTVAPPHEFVYLQRKKTLSNAIFAEVISTFAKITIQKQQISMSNTLILSTLFTQALLYISENDLKKNKVPSKIQSMLDFISSRVSENITLFDLSQHFGLSKQYICRLFKQHLKTSATEMILAFKMAWASEYLEVSSLNVNQIAEKLGFDNIYYFSRRFKQFYGVSPSEYRKRK